MKQTYTPAVLALLACLAVPRAEGVKKISPTLFEVRKTDLEPREDLNILVIQWVKPE